MAETDLGYLLPQIQETVRSLEQTLIAESQALGSGSRSPTAIDNIAQSKQELVAQINALVQESDQCLVAQGFAAGHIGIENWLASLPATHAAHGIWQAILDASIRCKDMNEANGIQIGLLRRRAQDSLSVLLGTMGGTETYGRDGAGRSTSLPRRSTHYTA